jgi:RNA polymerase sigma-70 factor (ECF subfamily)
MEDREFRDKVLPLNGRLFQFSLRILQNRHDAEDVVQEICMKLWDGRANLPEIKSIEAYAFRMTRNLCLDRIKKKKPQYYDDRQPGSGGFERMEQSKDPSGHLELKDTMQRVHLIIEGLPEQQRTLVQLRDIEGLEYEEISEITGMEVNAIRVGLSRARKKLRESIVKAQIL